VKLVDREAVIDKLVYTAANPVVDHLVNRVDHWPGVRVAEGRVESQHATCRHRSDAPGAARLP
jgi:hypothetical protein